MLNVQLYQHTFKNLTTHILGKYRYHKYIKKGGNLDTQKSGKSQ